MVFPRCCFFGFWLLMAFSVLADHVLAQEGDEDARAQASQSLTDQQGSPGFASLSDLDTDEPTLQYSSDAAWCPAGCGCWCCRRSRAPNMIGDFFNGYPAGMRGTFELDRLLVIANDLDVPLVLPPPNSTLTLAEPGPVGIYQTPVTSVQQLQQLLRSGSPVPPAFLVGNVADNATMTTALTIAQIQALLASTPGVAYDIVPLVAPPATYDTAVNGVFQTRNTVGGTTTYGAGDSGALLQGAADTLLGGEDFDAFYFYSYLATINVASPSAGIGPAGRMKVADGNSPLPRDRVYFRYGLFGGVPIAPHGVDLDRFTLGFEKTLWDGVLSLEMRFPFAASADSDMVAGVGGVVAHDVQFGNLAIYLKALIHATDRVALCGGLGVTSPTAEDLNVLLADNTPLVRIDNDSLHLQPFFAGLYTPNDRFFAQGFLQLDIDANGNSAAINTGNGLAHAGRLNDATFLFADLGIGYWLHQSTTSCLSGIAPTVELHYNTSLQQADSVTAGALRVGNFGDNVETLNLTVGATFEFGDYTNLAIGYITPLGGGKDQQLDGGLRILLDHYPLGGF